MPVYDREAAELSRIYESVAFEQVHKGILDLLPSAPMRALDVGAGSGRDAVALAKRGHIVTAVEPSTGMRAEAAHLHAGATITWIDDCLPELPSLEDSSGSFDLVLVSAVWMHLPPRARGLAMQRLSELMAPGGLLILTLRHGPADPSREMYSISAEEVVRDAASVALDLLRNLEDSDALCRAGVAWTTLVFRKSVG